MGDPNGEPTGFGATLGSPSRLRGSRFSGTGFSDGEKDGDAMVEVRLETGEPGTVLAMEGDCMEATSGSSLQEAHSQFL